MRKIPGEAKGHFKRLTKEILDKYGDEGKAELDALFAALPPNKIFSLPSGPDRGAKEAELISEMKVIARDFAEEKAKASRPKKKAPAKKAKAPKPKKPPEPQIVKRSGGKVDRFSYVIVEMDDGNIYAKINRKGRRIDEHDDAPKIYENKRLQVAFTDKDDAEFAVRRVINSAMVWYETHGIKPRERVRRSKASGRGYSHRTSAHKADIAKEERELAAIRRKKRSARRRKDRLLEEKVRKVKRNPSGKGIRHIPRVNPEKPSFFTHSEATAEKQAEKAFQAYVKYKDKFEESLTLDKPNFSWVMKSYDAIENSRANYLLSGNTAQAESVARLKGVLRAKINENFNECLAAIRASDDASKKAKSKSKSKAKTNPTAEVHGDIGRALMNAANRSMAEYELSGKPKDLIDAHDSYVSALIELKRGWASPRKDRATIDEISKAKAGVSKTRRELKKKMKG